VSVSGSILEIVLLLAFTTQIASSLAATAVGPSPTGIICLDGARARVDPQHRVLGVERHPDGAEPDRDAGTVRTAADARRPSAAVEGSSRASVPEVASAPGFSPGRAEMTHTALSSDREPDRCRGTAARDDEPSRLGSRPRRSIERRTLAAHTAPAPVATNSVSLASAGYR
jgi:hypothetical protein